MNSQYTFTTKVSNKDILELYIALTAAEKNILNTYGAQHLIANVDYNSYFPKNLCQYLWVSAANIIPQGYYALAERLLLEALSYANNPEDLGHIHANLGQVYADQGALEDCLVHCKKTLATGYFTTWAQDLIESLS